MKPAPYHLVFVLSLCFTYGAFKDYQLVRTPTFKQEDKEIQNGTDYCIN